MTTCQECSTPATTAAVVPSCGEMRLAMVAQVARMLAVPGVIGGRGMRVHVWHVPSEHAPCGQQTAM